MGLWLTGGWTVRVVKSVTWFTVERVGRCSCTNVSGLRHALGHALLANVPGVRNLLQSVVQCGLEIGSFYELNIAFCRELFFAPAVSSDEVTITPRAPFGKV